MPRWVPCGSRRFMPASPMRPSKPSQPGLKPSWRSRGAPVSDAVVPEVPWPDVAGVGAVAVEVSEDAPAPVVCAAAGSAAAIAVARIAEWSLIFCMTVPVGELLDIKQVRMASHVP